ncbi:MAG TPA: NDP-sugar synthase [Syntrophobacteraceae bacterium]|nr:NDP-sugar synthase [Syntrophobacteraceae bacterium]
MHAVPPGVRGGWIHCDPEGEPAGSGLRNPFGTDSPGCNRIVINLSYLPGAIENYFRDGTRWGCQIAYSYEGRIVDGKFVGSALGSAGGLKKVQDFSNFFDDTFLVVCGDALIDLDVGKLREFHRSRGAVATIALKEVPLSEVYRYGVVAVDETGRILRFQEKPRPEEAVSTTVNTGIYMFDPAVFEFIPSGVEYDIGGQLLPALVQAGAPFYGISPPFRWVDIGSIPDYWAATRLVMSGKIRGISLPGREIAPGIYTGINLRLNPEKVNLTPPVYIGSSTFIGDGATIVGPTVIGANCIIEGGAILKQCVIDDHVKIADIADISEKIIFSGNYIDPKGQYLDLAEADMEWVITDARKEINISETHLLLKELAHGAGPG